MRSVQTRYIASSRARGQRFDGYKYDMIYREDTCLSPPQTNPHLSAPQARPIKNGTGQAKRNNSKEKREPGKDGVTLSATMVEASTGEPVTASPAIPGGGAAGHGQSSDKGTPAPKRRAKLPRVLSERTQIKMLQVGVLFCFCFFNFKQHFFLFLVSIKQQ